MITLEKIFIKCKGIGEFIVKLTMKISRLKSNYSRIPLLLEESNEAERQKLTRGAKRVEKEENWI
ncbi:hypothetical protein KFK09_022293 [Dendrobium nobile]|uniref:Uncharacterized protein n=1 Tax=Dendrobium nobile TaxID=94219 RepID=A0A8T3AHH7_DENNO|nr:hypothetical protein KFK09_022293 [Dendrobium nobile]